MKNVFADRISAGSAGYSLRAFRNDLMAAIAKDKDLKDPGDQLFHFNVYFSIIYMMAAGHDDPSKIIYLLNRQFSPGLSEQTINFLIRRVKSDYGDFVELLTAIINSKVRNFVNLGASEEQALRSVDDWIRLELQ